MLFIVTNQRGKRMSKKSPWKPIESAPIKPFDKEKWYESHSEKMLLWDGYDIQIGSYGYSSRGSGAWLTGLGMIKPILWAELQFPPGYYDE